jgi:lysophospholipase L1-like esterase
VLAGAPQVAGAAPPDLSGAVALGDSYTAGEGSGPPFDPGTNVARNRCHRSPLAWPRLLGVRIDRHLACSGAQIANLTTGQTELAPDDRGQLARLAELPDAPSHVLLTLGGNDSGFGDIVAACVVRSCVPLIAARSAALPALGAQLEAAYREIAVAARGGRVLVVGYPDILPERPPGGLRCLWLSDAEVPAALGFIASLNATIAGAAARAGVEFVPIGDAFDGHELCTASSWMFPVLLNPFSINPQQAHPRAPGQAAIARRVSAYLEATPAPAA